MHVEPNGMPGMAHLYWTAVQGAQGYDVIAGDVESLRVDGAMISLGEVRVPARALTGTSWTEGNGSLPEDATPQIPATGRAFFYLVQYRDAHGASGFGTVSVPWPREPVSCIEGCPGAEAQTATAGGEP